MVYNGTVKGGVVIPDPSVKLPEGVRVRIEAIESANTPKPSPSRLHPVGEWDGPPGELERLLDEVQQMRDAELTDTDTDDDEPVSA